MKEGFRINQYQLMRCLGTGGMGEVWEAMDITNGGRVAVKGMHPPLARNTGMRKRMLEEARVLKLLSHPNIPAFVDLVESNDNIYLFMELVEGTPLDEWIRTESGPIPEKKVIAMFRQLLKGIDHAHQHKVIHRDIKPANLILTADQRLMILDFGIAHQAGQKRQTKAGIPMGTVYFMSPEQVKSLALDQRADIYSLGVTLFYMVTGQLPYAITSSEYDIYQKILNEPLPPARSIYPGVTMHLQRMIDRATAKSPKERFQSCGGFLAALTEEKKQEEQVGTRQGGGVRLRKRKWKGITLAVVLMMLGVTGILGYQAGWFSFLENRNSDPKEVARSFFDFIEDGKEEEAKSLANPACGQAVEMLFKFIDEKSRPKYRLVDGSEIGSQTARIKYTSNGDSYQATKVLVLEKQANEWLVKCKKADL